MTTSSLPVLLLASASPRRRELLAQLGVPHAVQAADIDETRRAGESASACVQRLALEKAARVHALQGSAARLPVLAADTEVVLGDQLFGKPGSEAEATDMLLALSGRTHRVLTAVVLQTASGAATALSDSAVTFRALSAVECAAYWRTGEPRDKAGGYAIQGFGAAFVSALHGSYSGVMGLPLYETATLLRQAGIACWQPAVRA